MWRRTGHASHTIVVYPPTGSTAYVTKMSTPPTLLQEYCPPLPSPCAYSSSFITPEGSKISHKNTKIHKITHKIWHKIIHKYTHTYSKTIKKTLKEHHIKQECETYRWAQLFYTACLTDMSFILYITPLGSTKYYSNYVHIKTNTDPIKKQYKHICIKRPSQLNRVCKHVPNRMFDFRCGQLTRCNVIQAACCYRNLHDVNLERLARTSFSDKNIDFQNKSLRWWTKWDTGRTPQKNCNGFTLSL